MVALLGTPGNGPKPVISTLVRARPPAWLSLGCIMTVTQCLRAMIGRAPPNLAGSHKPVREGSACSASSPMRPRKKQLSAMRGSHGKSFAWPRTVRAPCAGMEVPRSLSLRGAQARCSAQLLSTGTGEGQLFHKTHHVMLLDQAHRHPCWTLPGGLHGIQVLPVRIGREVERPNATHATWCAS